MKRWTIGAAAMVMAFAPCFAEAGDFWSRWGDGQAEMNGYDLVFPRYGEKRDGEAVLVFVTETFSRSKNVKADPGQIPKDDERPVLKLNFTRSFRTGVYDYHLMTSVFTSVDPENGRAAFAPVKIAFSGQEWCGMVYEERDLRGSNVAQSIQSYFLDESAAKRELTLPVDGVTEDELPILVRELSGERVAPGAEIAVPFLMSAERSRMTHKTAAWRTATLSKSEATESIATPAGKFNAFRWIVTPQDGPQMTFWVEAEGRRRLVKWAHADGETGLLRGSTRLPYWKLNRESDEKRRTEFGLAP